MVNYPAQIDNNISLPPATDNLTPVQGAVVNRLRDAILAVQSELGVKPSGLYTTVRNRLDNLENTLISLQEGGGVIVAGIPSSGQTISWNGISWVPTTFPSGFTAGGDLSGTATNQTVAKINGSSVPAGGSLTTGNVLQVSGSSALSYAALNLAGGSNFVTGVLPVGNQASQTMGGDVSGTTASSTVIKLQGRSVSSTAPTDGYVLTWVQGSTDWEPKPVNVFSTVTNISGGGSATLSGTNNLVLCSPSGGGCTVNAPASPVNAQFTVKDATAAASLSNKITVSGNGHNLEDPMNPTPGTFSSSIAITTPAWAATWAWDPGNTRWVLI